ncbi:MAG: 4Fe-4S binding protein [Deltaproteobacteria bacterium]|nr:4Fe-4S binding protein [Deltaproteobacteria bacterium]MBW2018355.1 4Fe-4S binding protein [Deltaproteobacteria bacterium]MBW2304132.1 4Fe-4S binding protein [Deltaproteobacteria bacterium]
MTGNGYRTIAFYPDRCDGCNLCVEACAEHHAGSKEAVHSRIRVCGDEEGRYTGIALCRQCSMPRCAMNCPAGALSKDPETGVVCWDEEKCVGCLLCTLTCPYGGIVFNAASGRVMKCDFCGGRPACVEACTRGALELKRGADLYNAWGDLEDLVVPGISACLGCNSELLLRHTLRRIGPNVVLATPPGCIAGVGAVGVNGKTAVKTPVFHPLLTNTASMLAGARRYYNRIGRDVTMLALGGDGGTADVGFQSLSGAAERGEQMIYICVDNEGYMNTGVQRSGTTPFGAWTSTTPVGSVLRGKTREAKPLPLLMVMHNCEYVATACTAFMEDYYEKLEKAIEASKKGMAYIHVFSPCPTGWRFPPGKLIEAGRKAVQTNIVPLWEFELKTGRIRFTYPVDDPLPVQEYLSLIGKFRHLDEEQIRLIQEQTERKIQILKAFTKEGRDGDETRVEGVGS